MSQDATSDFFDGIRSSRLLDDARMAELRARPEAQWGDVDSLAGYAESRGWLTAYQSRELRDGRGAGLSVGGYQIFDKLSEGPGGVAFKATHPALREPVSLRVLRSEWLGPADTATEYVARVHAASLAQSPHLAGVLDAGTHEESTFVVQEYVDGCDLFRLVNEMGALPLGLACEYVRQAALALAAAHAKGVAHGNVTPHALLLTPVNRTARSNGDVTIRPMPGATIKLAELGLTPRRPPVGELTFGQSDRLGPVAFYPPERLTSGDRVAAGDLYGLGATLYYLLTSRPPLPGDTPLEVLLNLQHGQPVAIETLRSETPPAVADLVRRLLARDPAARPPAAEVAEALLAHGEPSAAPPAPPANGVLLADETFTQPRVPTAVPVARDLDAPGRASEVEPFAEEIYEETPSQVELSTGPAVPLVEPLSERHLEGALTPLIPNDEPADDHHDAFDHNSMADTPRAPRKRTQATAKNKIWIIVGLSLHLTATCLCLGWLGVIPNPFNQKSSPTTQQIEEKKDSHSTTTTRKRRR